MHLAPSLTNRRPVPGSSDQIPLSPTTFVILRDAVNLARDEQIRSIEQLRARLAEVWPESADEIQLALQKWARYAHTHGAHHRIS